MAAGWRSDEDAVYGCVGPRWVVWGAGALIKEKKANQGPRLTPEGPCLGTSCAGRPFRLVRTAADQSRLLPRTPSKR
jgi:hypothetical protein